MGETDVILLNVYNGIKVDNIFEMFVWKIVEMWKCLLGSTLSIIKYIYLSIHIQNYWMHLHDENG